ncbi:NO-inducible flavohemoprotein [Shewanella sp.]|uniref:NO-inducible flavohemoprotein n=1 Tax=Shewanella sp. TaxID=50422 RepID=UPI0040539A36
MLTESHITIIKSTIPLLEQAGPELTKYFYQRMFNQHPELQHIFNMSHQHSGRQQVALFEALAAYAKNIDNLAALTTAVERIANKHTTFNIQADHYAIVGTHLIETLRELAPEAFTADVEAAWAAAYQFLAQIFIGREAEIYQQNGARQGGWSGGREFKLIIKSIESELISSFVFEPIDGAKVLDFKPGQYIGIEVQPLGADYKEMRQYSLSASPNGRTYRISVKRETSKLDFTAETGVAAESKPGVVSHFLHNDLKLGDTVTLYAPAGDFFLVDKQTPVTLISAGVGQTPMLSMLNTLSEQAYGHPVQFLHACENARQHAFSTWVTELTQRHSWEQKVWYNDELSDTAAHGLMDLTSVNLPVDTGNFYLCGPLGFMQFIKQQLLGLNVSANRIHYEVFGPHEAF